MPTVASCWNRLTSCWNRLCNGRFVNKHATLVVPPTFCLPTQHTNSTALRTRCCTNALFVHEEQSTRPPHSSSPQFPGTESQWAPSSRECPSRSETTECCGTPVPSASHFGTRGLSQDSTSDHAHESPVAASSDLTQA